MNTDLKKIVLASGNPGKLRELQACLQPLSLTLISQAALQITAVEENGLSFVENALLKARHAAQISKLPAIADDSGLAVSALDDAPGIYSARYGGTQASSQDNIDKLLSALQNVPIEKRGARFICVIAFLRHAEDPVPLICQSQWHGRILESPQGDEGFGYDPIFYIPDHQCSAAQLPLSEKNRISHRGQAMQQLLKNLEKIYEVG